MKDPGDGDILQMVVTHAVRLASVEQINIPPAQSLDTTAKHNPTLRATGRLVEVPECKVHSKVTSRAAAADATAATLGNAVPGGSRLTAHPPAIVNLTSNQQIHVQQTINSSLYSESNCAGLTLVEKLAAGATVESVINEPGPNGSTALIYAVTQNR